MLKNSSRENTLVANLTNEGVWNYVSEVPLAYAIIPARGGSKGFPGKNIALLQGKPLIAHTIEQAQRAEFIKEVIVSTEDRDIASVSEEWGATVVDRPEELAHDFSPSEDAIAHVMGYMGLEGNDMIVMLQCTSPIRRPWMIDNAIEMVAAGEYDSVLSAVKLHQFVWSDRGQGAYSLNYDPVTGMRPMRNCSF
jgi:N-acylneuraminate cytidylyltransferase